MNNRNIGEVAEVGAIDAINGHGITSQAIQVTKEVPQATEVDVALAYFAIFIIFVQLTIIIHTMHCDMPSMHCCSVFHQNALQCFACCA